MVKERNTDNSPAPPASGPSEAATRFAAHAGAAGDRPPQDSAKTAVRERAAAKRRVDDELQPAGSQQPRTHISAEVRPNEGWFRLLVEGVQDYAIFMLDPEGRVATWNIGAERIKGYRADEIIGRHFSRFYLPEDVKGGKPEAVLEAALREGRAEDEGWRLRKDGSGFWASVVVTALRDRDGRLIGFAKVTRDLTERRRVEAEIRATNAELARRADELTAVNRHLEIFSLLVASVVDYAIFVLDPVGRVTTWNIGAERIKGYRADEIVGRHFSRFYPLEDIEAGKPAMELREASVHGRFEDEGWRIRRDGSRFWANVVITALRDAGGRLVGFAKVTRDLTERKQAEEHRIQLALEREARAEAEAAVKMRDEFLSIASHELKTPLTPLLLQMQILLRSLRTGALTGPPSERLVGTIESAERQTRRFAGLVEQLLDVSRITAGRLELEPEEVDLAEIARSVAARFEAEFARSGSPLTLVLDGPVVGHWDRLRLEQVITNLLSNAIKYGAGQPIELRVDRDGETARLVVRDRGIGIAPVDQERIFRRFERAAPSRPYGGLGMGLYVARQIVEAHGGSVRVASTPGAGATFTVELPRGGAEPVTAVAS